MNTTGCGCIRSGTAFSCESRLLSKRNREAIALLYGIDNLLVRRAVNAAKHGVDAIEVGRCAMSDKELAATGIGARVRHAQGTWGMTLRIRSTQLALDLVARATGAGLASRALFGVRTATLDHEIVDHTMESKVVVETFLDKLYKVSDRRRRRLLKQGDVDIAARRGYRSFHGPGSSGRPPVSKVELQEVFNPMTCIPGIDTVISYNFIWFFAEISG